MSETPIDLLIHQMMLEVLFNKNQLLPRIRSEFMDSEIDFKGKMDAKGIPHDFGFDVLAQISLHKRADLKTMVGILWHHLKDSQATADMLLACGKAGLFLWDTNLKLFMVRYQIGQDVQEELDRFQFPLPMVVEPKSVETNNDTGYLCSGGSIILRNNHHDDDVCLDHINRMNRVRFTINANVVKMVKNCWKNLDRIKEGETKQEWEARKRAFEKYDRTAKDVITLLMKKSNHFHLTHRYDKRGRTYSMGYHVNYQGNDWCKACIEFADKEIVE